MATPNIDERQILTAVLENDLDLINDGPGLVIIGNKGYASAAIWHNRATDQPVTRSLIAYDH